MMDNTKQGRIDSVSKVKTNDHVRVHDIKVAAECFADFIYHNTRE